jgi:hypothetical protein
LVENKEVPDFNIGVPLVHTVSAQNRRTLHLQIVRLFCIASILHSFAISTNFKFVFQSVRLNPARVVFDIKLENGAQKVVTVKSALVLKNKTDFPLEVKLELPKGIVLATTLTIHADRFLHDQYTLFHSRYKHSQRSMQPKNSWSHLY